MQYYKWMYDEDEHVMRIPGFAFMSLEDATKYGGEFEKWCHGNSPKALFSFSGVNPTQIKQMLSSDFCNNLRGTKSRELSDEELQRAIAYFDDKPRNYFFTRFGVPDVPLMLSVGKTVGCIGVRNTKSSSHSDIEVLYCWPVKMVRIQPQEIIASKIVS
jgi:hypothetical protein